MKNLLLTICFVMALFFGSTAQKLSIAPKWLQTIITSGKVNNFDITEVKSYTYKSAKVYLVNYNVPCCDRFSAVLYDETGKVMGYPFGGFSGKGDMKHPDFRTERSNETLIFESEAAKKLREEN